MEVQRALGSDIAMALDECTRADSRRASSSRRSAHALWAERSRAAERAPGQLVFGIVQGATDMRTAPAKRADEIAATGFDGYAIGGLSVGEERSAMLSTVAGTTSDVAR